MESKGFLEIAFPLVNVLDADEDMTMDMLRTKIHYLSQLEG